MSRYDGSDSYTYPDSDVLKNKGNLTDQDALEAFEADATAIRLLEISQHPIQGKFDLAHLQGIHFHIFQDVYDWAGQLRTVDISKGSSRFAHCGMIQDYLGRQLDKLPVECFLKNLPPEEFVQRIAFYMGEINAAHPFREGNGRAQRAFCGQLAEQAGYFISFDEASRDETLAAMIASFHGDQKPLIALLESITAVIEEDK